MKILAVDSNSILNRAFYGVRPLTTREGQFTNGIFGFMSILLKLIDEVRPDALAFAFDLRAPTFRHERYSEYKGTRKGMPPELAQQVEPMKDILKLMGYKVLQLEGYEADDILGTIAAMSRKDGSECVIATGDRDSFQLIGSGVTVRLASTRGGQSQAEMIDPDAVKSRTGVTPGQIVDLKALMGDSSDNIPGVAGIGEKTASALISQFGSLDRVYENIDSPDIKESVRKKLIAGKDNAYLSRELATICCEVPLGITLNDLIPDKRQDAALYRLLDKLELKQAISRLGLSEPGEEPVEQIADETAMLTVSLNDKAAFEKLIGEDELFLAVNDSCAALLGSSLSVIENSLEGYDELLDKLSCKNSSLTLCDTKSWYHRSFARGFEPSLCSFDPSLAGYLLTPTASDYSTKGLCVGRHIVHPAVNLPEDVSGAVTAAVYDVLPMPALKKELLAELSQKDMLSLLNDIEAPLSRVLASMEYEGFTLDGEGLIAYGKELDADIAELRERIYLLAGGEFNINSPKQLGEVLFERLGLPAGKKTRTGYSTDADTLDKLRSKHPIVEDILIYRRLAKLKSTYVDGLYDKIGENSLVHTYFKQTETRTGRISSAEPNLQNIPVRTERGSKLRAFFTARDGHILIDADYSQIELRVLAHLADDKTMINAFLSDADIHTQTAAQVFDMPEAFVTPQMRSAAKAVNFGLVYGIGAYSLSQDIGVSVKEADGYMKAYFNTYSGVKAYMDKMVDKAKADGYVSTMFNRRRSLPELTASNHATRAFGERVARNTPIQGTAADIIKLAMVRVYNRLKAEGLKSKLILQVHDELIVEAPLDEADRAALIVTEEMEKAADLKVPLKADSNRGKNWLEAKG